MNSISKVALGVLAGFAAGALVGVLTAPAKGSETRKKIAGRGKAYADDAKNKFNELKSTATDKYDALENKGKQLLEKAGSSFDSVKNEVNNLASNEKNHQNPVTNQNRS